MSPAHARAGLVDSEHDNHALPPEEGGDDEAVTSIHWPATPDTVGGENELDDITIGQFLDTLAEIAMAIISRRQNLDS